jgi:hypothetical protein
LTVFLTGAVLLWRLQSLQWKGLAELSRQNQATLSSSLSLLEKAQALVAASDPLAYQAIRGMDQSPQYSDADYDPSDEGEMQRIDTRSGVTKVEDGSDDALDDITVGVLRDLFGT